MEVKVKGDGWRDTIMRDEEDRRGREEEGDFDAG